MADMAAAPAEAGPPSTAPSVGFGCSSEFIAAADLCRSILSGGRAPAVLRDVAQLPDSNGITMTVAEDWKEVLAGNLHLILRKMQSDLSVTPLINRIIAMTAEPVLIQAALIFACDEIPLMLINWLQGEGEVRLEDDPSEDMLSDAACHLCEMVVERVPLTETRLYNLIHSLLVLGSAIVWRDTVEIRRSQLQRSQRRSSTPARCRCLVLRTFAILVDLERRRQLARMPPTAASTNNAISLVLNVILYQATDCEDITDLGRRLKEYVALFSIAHETTHSVLTPETLGNRLQEWKRYGKIFLEAFLKGNCADLSREERSKVVANVLGPVVGIYSFLANCAARLKNSSLAYSEILTQNVAVALEIFRFLSSMNDKRQDVPYSHELELCYSQLMGAILVLLSSAIKMHQPGDMNAQLLSLAMVALKVWAEVRSSWASYRPVLTASGDPVFHLLRTALASKGPPVPNCRESWLHDAGIFTVLLLQSVPLHYRNEHELVKTLADMTLEIFSESPINVAIHVEGQVKAVSMLWELLSYVEAGSNCTLAEDCIVALCKLLEVFKQGTACAVARHTREWAPVAVHVKEVLGSSYDTSAAKVLMEMFINRLAETKQQRRCRQPWDCTVRVSKTKKGRSTGAASSATVKSVTPSDIARADAAMESLLETEAALESAIKAKAARRARRVAAKAAASNSQTPDVLPPLASLASPEVSASGPGCVKPISTDTPEIRAAAGDVDVDDVEVAGNLGDVYRAWAFDTPEELAVARRKLGLGIQDQQEDLARLRVAAIQRADAAMECLLLEEAALESAAKAKTVNRVRRKAVKGAVSKGKKSGTTSDLATSAHPGASTSKPVAKETHLTDSSVVGSAHGDADAANADVTPTESSCPSCHPSPEQAEVQQWMLCPITQEVFRDPVVCTDGFSYERSAAISWLESSIMSFVTGEQLSSKHLIPNLALRSRLRDLGHPT